MASSARAKRSWVKPTLIIKTVGETMGGLNNNIDGLGGEQPVQS